MEIEIDSSLVTQETFISPQTMRNKRAKFPNRFNYFLFAGAAMVLCVGNISDFRGTRVQDGPIHYETTSISTKGANGTQRTAIQPLPDQVKGWTDVVLRRPLFNPSRSPFRSFTLNVGAPWKLLRLSGIIFSPSGNLAIFTDLKGSTTVAIAGSRLDGFEVLSIGKESVWVTGTSGIEALHIEHAPAAATNNAGSSLVNSKEFESGPNSDKWPKMSFGVQNWL